MKLKDFFTNDIAGKAGFLQQSGEGNPLVTSLEFDSRKVQKGSMYFALPGLHADGHNFIGEAIQKGASVIVHEKQLDTLTLSGFEKSAGIPHDIVFIRTADTRFSMSPIAAAYHEFPADKLILAGVTGTEGKSTTVYLIWQLLRLAGKKAGFISTVQYSFGDEALWNPEHQTTPEATIIHKQLEEMVKNGCEFAVVETSSHGLSPRTNRLGDIHFDAAVMTTVTHEHLEFHGSWEQYRDDKANLFRSLDKRFSSFPERGPFGVINAADKSAAYFAAVTKQKTLTFNTTKPDIETDTADLHIRSITGTAEGNCYEVYNKKSGKTLLLEDHLPGEYNSANVLAALLVVSGLFHKPIEDFIQYIPLLEPVKGRMSPVHCGQPFEVLVDYAHTPSSFQTIFPPIHERIHKNGGRVISLFGSGGERDTKKRSEQGSIAAQYSDIVFLADEDPRGEDPMTILEDIAEGCETIPAMRREESLFLIPDRPAAIRKAFSLARPGDLVLLLGKGHENSIIYKDHSIPYDEISEAEKALEELR